MFYFLLIKILKLNIIQTDGFSNEFHGSKINGRQIGRRSKMDKQR